MSYSCKIDSFVSDLAEVVTHHDELEKGLKF